MTINQLNWDNFSWSNFQTLCIQIAENIFPDCNFEEYLKPGMKQDGIDLISVRNKDGRALTIQCKREQTLTESDLDRIINAFLNGKYQVRASHFILATSADLQRTRMKTVIDRQRSRLSEDYNIEFECWDRPVIEKNLKNMWRVVRYFFDDYQADGFCYGQLHTPPFEKLASIPYFIPRKIAVYVEAPGIFYGSHSAKNAVDLPNSILDKTLGSEPVCIIADAYQGKTSYLVQSAYSLARAGLRFIPLILSIKQHTISPIETLLNNVWGQWKSIPFQDLIIIVDGLDEVPAESFIEMVKHVFEFHTAYRPVKILISCRKLFYHHYEIKNNLIGFKVYELLALNDAGIDFYLKERLGDDKGKFLRIIDDADMAGILYHPFYLVNLTEIFIESPEKMPRTKLEIIVSAIDRSTHTSFSRQFKGGKLVKHQSSKFRRIVSHFAFSLQLSGRNVLTEEEMQSIFSEDELALLQHSALVTIQANSWGLSNSLFLEHLAASVIINLDFEQIVRFSTVGVNRRKVKTKWIQTLSSALSILDPKEAMFKKIFELLEQDNIELVFQTESSKYAEDVRLLLLEKLLQKFSTLERGPSIVYEDKVGEFVRYTPSCVDFLLDHISDTTISKYVKMICCGILEECIFTEIQQHRFREIFDVYVNEDASPDYAACLTNLLTSLTMGDLALLDRLTRLAVCNESHQFRSSVYQLITSLGYVDHFYQYGLSGLERLKSGKRASFHSSAEFHLKTFLLEARREANLIALLQSQEIKSYFIYDIYEHRTFNEELFNMLHTAFQSSPAIIVYVSEFIKDLGRRHLTHEYSHINDFLEKTGARWVVVRALIRDILNSDGWVLGFLIDSNSYDYILFELEETNMEFLESKPVLLRLAYIEEQKGNHEFYQLCLDATEGQIGGNNDSVDWQQQIEMEKLKKTNDILQVQSIDNFRNALKKYFDEHGKKSISNDDLEIEWDTKKVRLTSVSNILYAYLLSWFRRGKKVITLEMCLINIGKQDVFERFIAGEIYDYSNPDPETEVVMLPILERYYHKTISGCNFKNCYRDDGSKLIYRTLEVQIGEIFRRFKFKTAEKDLLELIWLDSGGTRSMAFASANKKETISQIVIDMLPSNSMSKLQRKIIENLNQGVDSDGVLGNHIGLCGKLGIREARYQIMDILLSGRLDAGSRIDAVEIYLDLGGEWQSVVELYKAQSDYNSYFFTELTSKLIRQYPAIVIEKGKEAFGANETTLDRKVKIAQIITQAGSIEALSFLVEVLSATNSPEHFQQGYNISKIDTNLALNEIAKISRLLLLKGSDKVRQQDLDAIRGIMLEWIYALGIKSEYDLNQVLSFLETEQKRLSHTYENTSAFNWFQTRVVEEFRKSDPGGLPISEIKKVLAGIE